MTNTRIHFMASQVQPAGEAIASMKNRYGQTPLEEAEVIVALGGDGFMLRTLHRVMPKSIPVFGMKIGNVCFLMNRFSENDLVERLASASPVALNPLRMEVLTESGTETTALATCPLLARSASSRLYVRLSVQRRKE